MLDGHGGYAAAQYLQSNLYRLFTQVLDQQGVKQGLDVSQDLPGLACPVAFTPLLTDVFQHADQDLLAWMHANAPGEERTAGCTATTCLVRPDLVRSCVKGGGRRRSSFALHCMLRLR